METLKQRILDEGVVVSNQLLRVDSFLNHQVDPQLLMDMGKEFAKRFQNEQITKVLTIESSGISIGFTLALELQVPMVFVRKKKTVIIDQDTYVARVPSFTKGIVTDLAISKKYLTPADRVVLVDDFIANGDAALAIIKMIEEAGATLVGVGIAIEKLFQAGGAAIRNQGVRVESLVQIRSLEDGVVQFS
jgi:xanthine phosphoribosyltransferase